MFKRQFQKPAIQFVAPQEITQNQIYSRHGYDLNHARIRYGKFCSTANYECLPHPNYGNGEEHQVIKYAKTYFEEHINFIICVKVRFFNKIYSHNAGFKKYVTFMIENKKKNLISLCLVAMETERDWVVNCRKNIENFPIQHKAMQNYSQIKERSQELCGRMFNLILTF